MKLIKKIILIILIFNFSLGFSQDSISVYLNKNFKIVKKKDSIKYIRIAVKKSAEKWKINYYDVDGNVKIRGFYTNKNAKIENGNFIYYYKTGLKKAVGRFVLGKKEGVWSTWHFNGNLSETGIYLHGKKEGFWRWFFKSGSLSSKEFYKKGRIKKYTFYNKDGTIVLRKPKFEEEAHFPGGSWEMTKFLKTETLYKPHSMLGEYKGLVRIKFSVKTNGQIKILEVEVDADLNPKLYIEAIRIINQMPKWIPGRQHNRPVEIIYTLPINFRGFKNRL